MSNINKIYEDIMAHLEKVTKDKVFAFPPCQKRTRLEELDEKKLLKKFTQ